MAKQYWLVARDGEPWLPPESVVELWRANYPQVFVDADEGRVIGKRIIEKCRDLLAAGIGLNPPPIEVIEREWAGALLVEVILNEEDAMAFRTVVKNGYLEMRFSDAVPARKRLGIALAAARILGYRVETVDD